MPDSNPEVQAVMEHLTKAGEKMAEFETISQAVQAAIAASDGVALIRTFITSARLARQISDELSQYADGIMDMFGV